MMLLVYVYMTIGEFRKDKISYVFETSSTIGQGIANQIRGDLSFLTERVKTLMGEYDSQSGTFSDIAYSQLLRDPFLGALFIYSFDKDSQTFILRSQLSNDTDSKGLTTTVNNTFAKLTESLFNHSIALHPLNLDEDKWLLALKFDQGSSDNFHLVGALVKQSLFMSSIRRQHNHSIYLLDSKFQVQVSNQHSESVFAENDISDIAKSLVAKMPTGIAVDEITLPKKDSVLLTMVRVGYGGFYLATVVQKKAAFMPLNRLTEKTAYFFGFLVSITLGLSVILSHYLTNKLKLLLGATRTLGEGNFNLKLDTSANDEVGELAIGFEIMAEKIQSLLRETEQKARMQNELKTAQLVQATLFPSNQFRSSQLELTGTHSAASECGGDWWHYKQVGHKFYVMIGDVTGHGAPAALVTSAACSAMSILELFPQMDLKDMVGYLNAAIFEVSKSKLGMTFFISCIDLETGIFDYCNASHNAPLLIRMNENVATRQNLEPLMEISGPPLGNTKNQAYRSYSLPLQAKDKIIFFTDGIIELANAKSEPWGERRFLTALIKALNQSKTTDEIIESLKLEAESFRALADLKDDVTYFLLKIN
jgi:sigma-B regulation protein RsbU (phosphoserine phosphatase)